MEEKKRKPNWRDDKLKESEKVARSEMNIMSTTLYGRVQPQAKDLEEAVLGAIMLEKGAFDMVSNYLDKHSFYVEAHTMMFGAMAALRKKDAPIDILTVVEELRKSGDIEKVGGAFAVAELTNRVGSAANVEYHSKIILEKWAAREHIRIASIILQSSYDDVESVMACNADAVKKLVTVESRLAGDKPMSSAYELKKTFDKLTEYRERKDEMIGLPTGHSEYDSKFGGQIKQDLIIVAARPGMGKTTYILNTIRNQIVDFRKPIGFFSLEMSADSLMNKLLSLESGVNSETMRLGKTTDEDHEKVSHSLVKLLGLDIEKYFLIDDRADITARQMRAKARKWKLEYDIQALYLDYIQLTGTDEDEREFNREQEVAKISRTLKKIAKELDIPVIALAQLSRATEQRKNKLPELSDLRESGAIEQDADMVVFLFRPEYYGTQNDDEGNTAKNLLQVICRKHRNGAVGKVSLKYVPETNKITDWDGTRHTSSGKKKDAELAEPAPPIKDWTQSTFNSDDKNSPF